MRKARYVAVAIVAALALLVGVFAYPVVAGIHPLAAGTGTPATAGHSRTADDSPGNETNETETGDHQVNETENETGSAPSGSDVNDTENDTGSVSGDQGATGSGEDGSSGASGVDVSAIENSIVSATDSLAAELVSGARLVVSASLSSL